MQVGLQDLTLGDFVAQRDLEFRRHWIATPATQEASRREVSLILAAKGGGKTALRRQLCEVESSDSKRFIKLDLETYAYATIARQATDLSGRMGLGKVELLTRYWMHLLLLHALRAIVPLMKEADEPTDRARDRIMQVLGPHAAECPDRNLSSMLQRALDKVKEWLGRDRDAHEDVNIRALTADELDQLEQLSASLPFVEACLSAAGYLYDHGIHVCTIIEGIDKVAAETPRDALSLTLDAVVRAADRLTKEEPYLGVLSAKVLMPREFFGALTGRDIDHLVGAQRPLHWYPDDLKKVLQKRLDVAASNANLPELIALDSILPQGSSSWMRMVRHSLYRPRQLLNYLDAIRQGTPGMTATAAVFEVVIRNVSSSLIQPLIEENAVRLPRLGAYLQAIRGTPSVCKLGALRQLLSGNLGLPATSAGLRTAISELYVAGIIGLIEPSEGMLQDPSECSRTEGGTTFPIYCEFSFKPHARPSWISDLTSDRLVCIHPIVHSYAQVQPAAGYVIG